MEPKTIDLRDLFLRKQETLCAALTESRSVIPHQGEKGTASELRWLEMLQEHLPRRYNVRKGFVIDCEGKVSEQIDIIIHDAQYSPFLLEAESTCFVPAESVYAVFDSKQTVSKSDLEQAADKARSVRRLRRTSGQIHHLGGVGTKEPKEILAGIVALESMWSPPFGESFEGAMRDLSGERALQIGCALRHGAFEAYRDDDDVLHVNVSPAEVALMSFFLGLLALLQRLGTAPALDLGAYSSALLR